MIVKLINMILLLTLNFEIISSKSDYFWLSTQFIENNKWSRLTILAAEANINSFAVEAKEVLMTSVKQTTIYTNLNLWRRNGSSDFTSFVKEPTEEQHFLCFWNRVMLPYIEMVGENCHFCEHQKWLIVLHVNQTLDEFLSSIGHIPIYMSSEVYIAENDASSTSKWKIFEVWRIGPLWKTFERNQIGEWTKNSGLKLKTLVEKHHRRKDLKGYPIKAIAPVFMPYVFPFKNLTNNIEGGGFYPDIFTVFKEQLNFTYTVLNSKDYDFLFQMLYHKEADILISPTSSPNPGNKTSDNTIETHRGRFALFLRRPSPEPSWALYILPFTPFIWVCLPCFIIFIAFCCWFINRIAIWFRITRADFSLQESLWIIYSALVQQGSDFNTELFSVKILFLVTLLSLSVIYTVYSAFLVSFLTTLKPKLPFRTFEELLEFPDWSLGTTPGRNRNSFLMNSPEGSPIRLAYERNLLPNKDKNIVKNRIEGLKRTLEGKYCFFESKRTCQYLLRAKFPLNESSLIVDTGAEYGKDFNQFSIQYRSPFLPSINKLLMKLYSSGILKKLSEKYWPKIQNRPSKQLFSPGLKESIVNWYFACWMDHFGC